MAETHTGRCYCGAVEIEMRGEPLEMGYCHCENCRRYFAASVSAFDARFNGCAHRRSPGFSVQTKGASELC